MLTCVIDAEGNMAGWKLPAAFVAVALYGLFWVCNGYMGESGKECTYFGGSRVSASESSLVNCSWYASNACCKRTEVTSVFGGMYPLFGATKECFNQMNYLMCYFCSPEQYRWYNKKAYVCAEFCRSVFEHCRTAQYEGRSLGSAYNDGESFCLGQKFEVVEGNGNCFKFDPTVFARAFHFSPSIVLYISSGLSFIWAFAL